jgi:subtilisin
MEHSATAKSLDPSRPQYLVLFRKPSEKNTQTLSTTLHRERISGTQAVRAGRGVAVLSAGATDVPVRVFEKLGVAAADLTENQRRTLEKRDDVECVVENLIRYLPPVRRSIREAPRTVVQDRASEYLRGVRDSAELALAYLEGRAPGVLQGMEKVTERRRPRRTEQLTWGLRAMGITAQTRFTGRGIRVAVLDTGIDLTHPDLSAKVVEGQTAVSFVNGISVQDVNGHGTHCSGVVAGPVNSAGGTRYGVAPDVELLVGKVFNNNRRPSASDDDIIEAITWADERGARVISMSLGSERAVDEPSSAVYETVANQLFTGSENSVLLVAAAGNESDRPNNLSPVGNPAACASLAAVAAVDAAGDVAYFSCATMDTIGLVDVAGPGVDILSAYTGGGFMRLDGTSMATPHVAGLAALYLERNPTLTAQGLWNELRNRANGQGDPDDVGSGLVQL